jgi:hypothetical protein
MEIKEILGKLRFMADTYALIPSVCIEAKHTIESQMQRIAELETELKAEMYRHDRYVDFELAEAEELRQVKAERDAAIGYLERIKSCGACKHSDSFSLQIPKACRQCNHGSNWEWCGVKPEVDHEN